MNKFNVGDRVIWNRDGMRGIVVNTNKYRYDVLWDDADSPDNTFQYDYGIDTSVKLDPEYAWYIDLLKLV